MVEGAAPAPLGAPAHGDPRGEACAGGSFCLGRGGCAFGPGEENKIILFWREGLFYFFAPFSRHPGAATELPGPYQREAIAAAPRAAATALKAQAHHCARPPAPLRAQLRGPRRHRAALNL